MHGKIQFSIMQLDKQDTLIIFLTSTYKNKEKTGEKLMELMIPSKKGIVLGFCEKNFKHQVNIDGVNEHRGCECE